MLTLRYLFRRLHGRHRAQETNTRAQTLVFTRTLKYSVLCQTSEFLTKNNKQQPALLTLVKAKRKNMFLQQILQDQEF